MTIAISDGDRNTYLRAQNQGLRLYMAVDKRASVWEGTLDSAPDYPAAQLTVTGTGGSIGNVSIGYTLMVYSSAGTYKGWLRIRDNCVATTLEVAECGQGYIDFAAGDVLKIYPWRRPVAKYHAYNGTYWLADYNKALSDNTADFGPLGRIGPPAIGFRDPDTGECTLKFVGEYTETYTPSGSVSTYAWEFPESESAAVAGTAGSPISKTFADAHSSGAEVLLTVTDSDSKIHRRYSVMWTFDRTGSDAPLNVAVASIDSTLGVGGVASAYLYGQYDTDALPMGAYVVLFGEINYGGTVVENLGSTYPYRTNVLIAGYILSETQVVVGVSGQMYTEVQIATVDEIMRRRACYPIQMISTASGPTTWSEVKNLTVARGAVVWSKWYAHLDMCDVHTGNYADDQAIAYLDPPEGALWDQAEYFYPNTIMGIAGCSLANDLYMDAWYQVTPAASKWLTAALNIEQADLAGEVRINYRYTHESAQEVVSGVSGSASLYSRAPDDPKGYDGVTFDQPPGLAPVSQDDLNEMTGLLRAYKNRMIESVTIPMSGYVPIDANPQTVVNLTISAAEHPRGFAEFASGMDLLVTSVSHQLQDDFSAQTVITAEPVAAGPAGIAFSVDQGGSTGWDEYNLGGWEYDWSYGDWPVAGDTADPTAVGEALATTDIGLFATSSLRNAFAGNIVRWESRNNGIPYGAECGSFRIVAYNTEQSAWTAIMVVSATDDNDSGLYRNTDVWNPSSIWELVYSYAEYETDVGLSITAQTALTLRTVGTMVYAVFRHTYSGNLYWYIVRSADGGATWVKGTNQIGSDAYAYWQHGLGVSANNAGTLFAARLHSGTIALIKSADYGDTWSLTGWSVAAAEANRVFCIEVPYEDNASDLTVWFSYGTGNLMRSQDGGATASAITPDGSPSGYIDNQSIHSYTLDGDVIAIAYSGGSFQTTANGNAVTPTFTEQVSPDASNTRFLGGWPNDPNWFALAMVGGVFMTDDGGGTWYDGTGNLADFGVTEVRYLVPRSIR